MAELKSIEPVIDELRWSRLQRRVNEQRALDAFALIRSHGIEPILIKGVAAEVYYPASHGRPSIDVDLAVDPKHFSAACQIASRGVAIDLHRGLRHLDTVPWIDIFENSRELKLSDGSIRVPRPEDHLRVLCVHWLTDGGSYHSKLWDIYYAVQNRDPDFDWDRFAGVVSHRRRRWLECVLGVTAMELGLDLNSTPYRRAADHVPAWVQRTIASCWADQVRLKPLEATLHDRRAMFSQAKKRLRPNPIYATVDCDGDIDSPIRVHYQLRNFIRRIRPSYRRIINTIRIEANERNTRN